MDTLPQELVDNIAFESQNDWFVNSYGTEFIQHQYRKKMAVKCFEDMIKNNLEKQETLKKIMENHRTTFLFNKNDALADYTGIISGKKIIIFHIIDTHGPRYYHDFFYFNNEGPFRDEEQDEVYFFGYHALNLYDALYQINKLCTPDLTTRTYIFHYNDKTENVVIILDKPDTDLLRVKLKYKIKEKVEKRKKKRNNFITSK